MNIAIFLLLLTPQIPHPDPVHLSLRDAVARALEANPALLAHEARADAVAQRPLEATPAFLPSLSFGVQGMRTTDPVGVFGLKLRHENFAAEDLALDALNRPSAYAGYGATATIQVPILAPEGLYGFRAAQKAADAARAGARRAAGATRYSTVQAYTGALLAARQVAALDTALAAVRGHVTQAQAMNEQGLVTGLDARLASLRGSEIEVQRLNAHAQAQNALSALNALLDLPDDTDLVLLDDLATVSIVSSCASDDPAGEPDCSLEGRGDLQAYMAGVEAASSGVKMAWASQLPAVAAFGSLGQYARNAPFGQGSGDWTIGIGLTWTPFNGLAGVGGVRAARAEQRAVTAERDAAYRQAEVEVLQARRMVEAATQAVVVAARASRESRVALEQARARYASGTAPITELLDVQAASTNATLAELAARRDLALAHAAMDLAYGVFDR
jgi:outer membrane protein TolC